MSKLAWRVTTMAVSLPLGFAVRKAVAVGWRAVRHEDPPAHTDQDARWGETLAWAAVSAVAIAAAELIAVRAAAIAWRSITGDEPPGADDPPEIEP